MNIVVSIPDNADQTTLPVNAVSKAVIKEIYSGETPVDFRISFNELLSLKIFRETLYMNMQESKKNTEDRKTELMIKFFII